MTSFHPDLEFTNIKIIISVLQMRSYSWKGVGWAFRFPNIYSWQANRPWVPTVLSWNSIPLCCGGKVWASPRWVWSLGRLELGDSMQDSLSRTCLWTFCLAEFLPIMWASFTERRIWNELSFPSSERCGHSGGKAAVKEQEMSHSSPLENLFKLSI